jgi:RNA methyltransferase, TrmH family
MTFNNKSKNRKIPIQSRSNPRVKDLLKQKHQYFFFEGTKLVKDILNQKQQIHYLILTENSDPETFRGDANIYETWVVNASVMSKLSTLKDPPEAMAIVEVFERPVDFEQSRVVVAVDGLQDPGNAGTIFRCAAAFDIDAVVLTGESVTFNNTKFLRAAQNALFHVHFQRVVEVDTLIMDAEVAGLNIYLTSSHSGKGVCLPHQMQTPCLLVLGNEGQGLRPDLLALFPRVTIPQTGAVESLNVGVSAGIMMYQLRGKNK